ncbi:MAG: ferredoxin family protein [Selenomonadaceae bacterium]
MALKFVTSRCKGCGICAYFCPKKVLTVTELNKAAIAEGKENDCISCGQCEMRCPDYAIFVEREAK